jgi:enoyl-CoA hydratase
VSPEGRAGYSTLVVERPQRAVLLVTLNRPEVLNAMNTLMHSELRQLFAEARTDSRTSAVVITGAGRAFSAGADLKQPDSERSKPPESGERIAELALGMVTLDKPIVTAVNGVAVGAGAALALMADIPIVASDARLIDGQTRMGVTAGEHALLNWPILSSFAWAKYLLLTSESIEGAEAERIGLVGRAVPREDVVPEALEVATRLAAGSRPAIRGTKRALNHWILGVRPAFAHSLGRMMLDSYGDDTAEARAAFRERRAPVFPSAGTHLR